MFEVENGPGGLSRVFGHMCNRCALLQPGGVAAEASSWKLRLKVHTHIQVHFPPWQQRGSRCGRGIGGIPLPETKTVGSRSIGQCVKRNDIDIFLGLVTYPFAVSGFLVLWMSRGKFQGWSALDLDNRPHHDSPLHIWMVIGALQSPILIMLGRNFLTRPKSRQLRSILVKAAPGASTSTHLSTALAP